MKNNIIKILLVEDRKEEISLKYTLKEFSSRIYTELFVFDSKNELMNFLDEHRNEKESDSYCTMIFFNCSEKLDTIIDIIKKIKADSSFKTIPIFVISSNIDRECIKEVYNSYANAYIIKPEDLEGLIIILERFKEFWGFAQLPTKTHK